MSTYSLDSDTITKLLKKHPGNRPVVDRFRREIQWNSLFIICPRHSFGVCDVPEGQIRVGGEGQVSGVRLQGGQSEILRCAQNDRGRGRAGFFAALRMTGEGPGRDSSLRSLERGRMHCLACTRHPRSMVVSPIYF